MVITDKDTLDICKIFVVRKKHEIKYLGIDQVKFVENSLYLVI